MTKQQIPVTLTAYEKEIVDSLAGNDKKKRARVIYNLKNNKTFQDKTPSGERNGFIIGENNE